MVFNENGIIINNGYQLDVIINEGFTDIANKGLKTVHGWIRKIIDAVQNTIEYASRIKYDNIIKNIHNMSDEEFSSWINSKTLIYPYIESEGYGKWIENFNKALDELKRNNNTSTEEINKILYEGKDKNEWFKNGLKNYNASGKKPDTSKLKKIVTNLQDFTKPLRKSYSELKILNTNINKGMKISSDVMKEMHSYCINAISAYRIMSKILITDFSKDNDNNDLKNNDKKMKDLLTNRIFVEELTGGELKRWFKSNLNKVDQKAKMLILKPTKKYMRDLGYSSGLDTDSNIVQLFYDEDTNSVLLARAIGYERINPNLQSQLDKSNGIIVVD